MAFDRVTQYGVDPTSRGAANAQALTYPFSDDVSPEVFESFGDEDDTLNKEAHPATGGNPIAFMLILVGLIVAMFIFHRVSSVIPREAFGVNWLNFFQVGVMATFFILLIKAVFGRYHVRGITNAVAAI